MVNAGHCGAQAGCMHLATKEKMRYEKLLTVSEVTIVVCS